MPTNLVQINRRQDKQAVLLEITASAYNHGMADTTPVQMNAMLMGLSTQPGVRKLLADWQRLSDAVLDAALEIQAIPAPTFDEGPRADYVRRQFMAHGLADVALDETGNVWARTPGGKPHLPALVVSAHLDTVFGADADLTASRKDDGHSVVAPGLGDNSLGLAGIIALARQLRERAIIPEADIWWVATIGEEGLGDLRGMRHALDRLGDRTGAVLVIEGLGLGRIFHSGLPVRRLRVDVSGPGGHSWLHSERPSAIHQLVAIGADLLTVTQHSGTPRTTLNIGLIEGGTTINSRAAQASLSIDLRSEDPDALARIERDVMSAIARTPRDAGLNVATCVIGDRPFGRLRADHPLVVAAQAALESSDWGSATLDIGSTDANIPLSRRIPAVCIGLTTGGDAHTFQEHVDTRPLPIGMRQLTLLVLAAAQNFPEWAKW